MATEAQIRASIKYDKANTMMLNVKLNRKSDADIIDKIEKVGNKSAYIKGLIREDIDHK